MTVDFLSQFGRGAKRNTATLHESESRGSSSDKKKDKLAISYSAERVIGNGSFGVVYQATVIETGPLLLFACSCNSVCACLCSVDADVFAHARGCSCSLGAVASGETVAIKKVLQDLRFKVRNVASVL